MRSRSIDEGVSDGGDVASAHSDPVVLGLGVMVCALSSAVEFVGVVGVVGVLEEDGSGRITGEQSGGNNQKKMR